MPFDVSDPWSTRVWPAAVALRRLESVLFPSPTWRFLVFQGPTGSAPAWLPKSDLVSSRWDDGFTDHSRRHHADAWPRNFLTLLLLLFLSKCLHSLVHLSLPSSMSSDTEVSATEEAWGYFEDALSILSSTVSGAGKQGTTSKTPFPSDSRLQTPGPSSPIMV